MLYPIHSELQFVVGEQHNEFVLKSEYSAIVLFDWEGRVGQWGLDESNANFIAADVVAYIVEHTQYLSPVDTYKIATAISHLTIAFVEVAASIRNKEIIK